MNNYTCFRVRIFAIFIGLVLNQLSYSQSIPKVYLNYEQLTPSNCAENEVCFNMQIKTDPDSTINFYAINIRMFFDNADLEFESFSSLLGDFYSSDSITILANNEVDIGFDEPYSVQYNVIGVPFLPLLQTLDANYLNFAEICFTVQNPPNNGADLCNSLVWDLKEDLSGGITFNTDGVTVIHYVDNASFQTQENANQLNWQYTSSNTGIKNQNNCLTWPCDPNCSLIVLNNLNSGVGSLRGAINCALNNDTILFSDNLISDTIELHTNPININKTLNIIANPNQNIYIKTSASFLFMTSELEEVSFQNINLIAGFSQTSSIILNNGELKLTDVNLTSGTETSPNSTFILNNGVVNFKGTNNLIIDE